MEVPIVIFVLCVWAGAYAAVRWLPSLPSGSIGGLAFLLVCGLIGAGTAVLGLRIYGVVETLSHDSTGVIGRVETTDELAALLWESGTLFALAGAVFLIACRDASPMTSAPEVARYVDEA
jgi:hypothetical protein